MKNVDIVSKIVLRDTGTAQARGTASQNKVDLSGYLQKSIWDFVFSLEKDNNGEDYIFSKLPVVTQYGITMYSGKDLNLPSLFEGLPIDNDTLIWDENGVLKVNPSKIQTTVVGLLGSLSNVDSSVDGVASVDRILYQPKGSSVWTWKNVNDIVSGGGSSGATGDVLSAIFGSNSANSIYDFYYTGVQGGGGQPSTSPFGSLLTLPYRKAFGNTIPDYAAQIFIPNGDDATPFMYYRTSLANRWNEWKTVVSLKSNGLLEQVIFVQSDYLKIGPRISDGHAYISYNGDNNTYLGDIGYHKGNGLPSIWMDSTGWRPIIYGADYNGNLIVTGGITMYSDQRKKTILNHVELSLKQIANAPLIQHYYNSDQDKTTHVGSIAQYWAGINDWFCKLDAEGFYTMEIQNCALASAISIARHLEKYESKTDKTIRKMKQRIADLENEVERLKKVLP